MRVKAENLRVKAVVLRRWTSTPLAQYRRVSARPALILGYLCVLVLAVRSGWFILRVYKKGQLCLAPDLVRVQGVCCPSSIGIWQGRGVFGKGEASFFFSLYVRCVGTGIRKAGGIPEIDPYESFRPFTLYT